MDIIKVQLACLDIKNVLFSFIIAAVVAMNGNDIVIGVNEDGVPLVPMGDGTYSVESGQRFETMNSSGGSSKHGCYRGFSMLSMLAAVGMLVVVLVFTILAWRMLATVEEQTSSLPLTNNNNTAADSPSTLALQNMVANLTAQLNALSAQVALSSTATSSALPNNWCSVNIFKWLCPILDTLANAQDDALTEYAAPYTEEEYAAIHATMLADGEQGFAMVPSSGAGKAGTAVSMQFATSATRISTDDDIAPEIIDAEGGEEEEEEEEEEGKKKRKRAVILGDQSDHKAARSVLTADYGVDYDDDEVDDFAVVHANTGTYIPETVPTPLPSIAAGTVLRFTPDDHDWTVAASTGNTLLTAPDGTYGSFRPLNNGGAEFWPLSHSFSIFGETYQTMIYDMSGSVWTTRINQVDTSILLANTLSIRNTRLTAFGTPFIPACAFNASSRGAYRYSNATLSIYTVLAVPHQPRSANPNACASGSRVSSTTPTSTFQIVLYAGTHVVEYRYGQVDNALFAQLSGAYAMVGISAGADAPIAGHVYPLNLGTLLTAAAANDQVGATVTHADAAAIITAYGTISRASSLNRAPIVRKLLARTGDVFDHIVIFVASKQNGTVRVNDFEKARVAISQVQYLYPGGSNVGGLGWRLSTSQSAANGAALGSTTGELEDVMFATLDLADLVDTSEKQLWAPHYEAYFQPIVGTPIAKYSDVFNDTFSPYYGTLTTNNKRRLYHEENIRYKRADEWFTQSALGTISRALIHRYGTPTQAYGQPGVTNTTLLAQKAPAMSMRSVGGWNPFVHTPLRRGQFTTAGRYSQYRPYADVDADGRYIIEIRRDPTNPLRFLDVDDPTAVFPETDDGRFNVFYAQCQALGKQMFVVAPGSVSVAMSPVSQVLAGLRGIDSLTLEEDTSFFVDEPQSVYASVGVNPAMDPLLVGILPASRHANTVFCGKRRNFRWSQNVLNGTAVAAVAAAGFLAPTTFGFASPFPMPGDEINRKFKARSPQRGDEQDDLQTTEIAQRAGLQAYVEKYRLNEFPIDQPTNVKKQLCNNASVIAGDWSPLRRSLDCVDQKNVAIVVLLPPGETLHDVDRETMIKLHRVANQYVNTVVTDGYGARGRQFQIGNDASTGFPVYGNATADFLPKYFFGLQPVMK
jgi:hypothetical protein